MNSKKRNQSLECCRMIAAVFVVFIHYKFPEPLTGVVDTLARFAVPFFFMISGFFSYQAGLEKIKGRLAGAVKLNIAATGLYLVWKSYVGVLSGLSWTGWGREYLTVENITIWFLLQQNPVQGHLWYLSAVVLIYACMYLYICWQKDAQSYRYQPLYLLGIILFLIHLLLSSFAVALDVFNHFLLYRNGLLFGFPMFMLGVFLREYYGKITDVYHLTTGRLGMLLAVGAGLAVFQKYGIGSVDLPVGSVILAAALLLLANRKPNVSDNRVFSAIISGFGGLSTYIYVTHPFWEELYSMFFAYKVERFFDERVYAYLLPLIVLFISITTGIFWETGRWCIRSLMGYKDKILAKKLR